MRLAIITSEGNPRDLLVAPEGSGIQIDRYPMRVQGFARNPYDRMFVELGHVDACESAVAAGCDAIFIDTFADYGIQQMRCVAPMPVIGAGEAGIAAASEGGRSFSIVTVWPESMSYLYDERLFNSPGGDRCVKVHHVSPEIELAKLGTEYGIKSKMERGDGSVIEYLAERCRQAYAEDGVEAIMLGCTCMAPIGPALQERCDFPVIECTRAGLKVAFETVLAGTPAREVSLSPRRGTIPLILDAWLEHGIVPEFTPDMCEVCVIVGDPAELAASAS